MLQFQTYIDSLKDYPETDFVISLGPLPKGATCTEGRYLEISNPSLDSVKQINSVDPRAINTGISLHIDSRTHEKNRNIVELLKKYIAFWFVKFLRLPLSSTKIPDELGVRESHPDDPVAEINKLKNLPLHLTCPIIDKARGAGKGFPAILLIPGPSLNSLHGKLKALSEKAIIICVSRTLNFAIEEGVEPDILIQLDANFMQRQLFPKRSLENTYLFANSLTPIHDIAQRFRHTFFVDSFDTSIIPNQYRPKESWLSSLMLCIGTAETLQFSELYLAGVDLSYQSNDTIYFNDQETSPQHNSSNEIEHTDITIVNSREFTVPDMHGNLVTTTLQYYATAFEAEMLVQDIMQSTKTLFFNLTNAGILSPVLIPPATESRFEQLPIFNRIRFQKRLDAMFHLKEDIKMGSLLHVMETRVQHVRDAIARAQRICPETNPEECKPILKSMAALFIDNPGVITPEDNLQFNRNLLGAWLEEAMRARMIAVLYREARTNPIPLLCSPDEFATCAMPLMRNHPDWAIDVHTLTDQFSQPTTAPTIAYNQLHANYLRGKPIVLVTRNLFAKYGYLLKAIPSDNVLEYSPELFL